MGFNCRKYLKLLERNSQNFVAARWRILFGGLVTRASQTFFGMSPSAPGDGWRFGHGAGIAADAPCRINDLRAHTGASRFGGGRCRNRARTVATSSRLGACASPGNRVSSGCRSRRKKACPESCSASNCKRLWSGSIREDLLFQASHCQNK